MLPSLWHSVGNTRVLEVVDCLAPPAEGDVGYPAGDDEAHCSPQYAHGRVSEA